MKFAQMLSRYMEEDAEVFAECLDYHRLKVIIKDAASGRSFLVVLTDEVNRIKQVFETRALALVQQADAMLKRSQANAATLPTVDALVTRAVRVESFYHLNITGIRKICKKFVKASQMGQTIPAWTEIAAPLLRLAGEHHGKIMSRVSRLYHRAGVVAQRPSQDLHMQLDAAQGHSRKYVVPEDKVLELALRLGRRLVVVSPASLLGGDDEDQDDQDDAKDVRQACTTLYYDTPDMATYRARGGSEASVLRVRYQDRLPREGNVSVECKTHADDSGKEVSGKMSLSLPVQRIHQFLYSEWDPSAYLTSVLDTRTAIDDAVTLANEIQHKVMAEKLAPVVRSDHIRMSFAAVIGRSIVRVTLEAQLRFIKEDPSKPKAWTKDPEAHAASWKAPFALVEVKVFGEDDVPADILDTIQSLALPCPFSKFRAGCAIFYEELTREDPDYFADNPIVSESVQFHRRAVGGKDVSPASSDGERTPVPKSPRTPSTMEDRLRLGPSAAAPVYMPPAPAPAVPKVVPAATAAAASSNMRRIEPKTFFANERTFLHWQHQAVLVLLLGASMLSYHPESMQELYSTCGLIVMIIGALTLLYSLFRFYWRLRAIEVGNNEGFIDRYGPPFISLSTFVALFIVFFTALSSGDVVSKNPLKATRGGALPPSSPSGYSQDAFGIPPSSSEAAPKSDVVLVRRDAARQLHRATSNWVLDPVVDTYKGHTLTRDTVITPTGATVPLSDSAVAFVSSTSTTTTALEVLLAGGRLARCEYTNATTPSVLATTGRSSSPQTSTAMNCRAVSDPRLPEDATAAARLDDGSYLVVTGVDGRTVLHRGQVVPALSTLHTTGDHIVSLHVVAGDVVDVLTRSRENWSLCLARYDLRQLSRDGTTTTTCRPVVAIDGGDAIGVMSYRELATKASAGKSCAAVSFVTVVPSAAWEVDLC
eukprot:PhM_4_TR10108/c0_g1_i1/m.31901